MSPGRTSVQILARCTECGRTVALYEGDLVGIPFARLAEILVDADAHDCKPPSVTVAISRPVEIPY